MHYTLIILADICFILGIVLFVRVGKKLSDISRRASEAIQASKNSSTLMDIVNEYKDHTKENARNTLLASVLFISGLALFLLSLK